GLEVVLGRRSFPGGAVDPRHSPLPSKRCPSGEILLKLPCWSNVSQDHSQCSCSWKTLTGGLQRLRISRALVLIEHGSRHCPASHRDSTTFVHAGSACNESSLCSSGSSSIQSWRRNGIHLRRDATCECRQPGDSDRFRARARRGALSVPPRGQHLAGELRVFSIPACPAK